MRIRRGMPGLSLVWKEGRLHESWTLPSRKKTHTPYARAIKDFNNRFASSMNRCLERSRNHIALPLSGGRDSRHILYEMLKQGRAPNDVFTAQLGRRNDPLSDHAIAKEVASRNGLPHRTITIEPKKMHYYEQRKNLLCGIPGEEGSWMVPVAETLHSEHAHSIYDGIGGDILSAGLFLSKERMDLMRNRRYTRLADCLLQRANTRCPLPASFRLANKILGTEKLSPERARKELTNELALHDHQHNPTTSFFFLNRTLGVIANTSFGIYQNCGHVFTPFLDDEVFSLLFSMPEEMFFDKNFHDVAIIQNYPQIASVPYTGPTNIAPLTGRLSDRIISYASLLRAQPSIDVHATTSLLKWAITSKITRGRPSLSFATVCVLCDIRSHANG